MNNQNKFEFLETRTLLGGGHLDDADSVTKKGHKSKSGGKTKKTETSGEASTDGDSIFATIKEFLVDHKDFIKSMGLKLFEIFKAIRAKKNTIPASNTTNITEAAEVGSREIVLSEDMHLSSTEKDELVANVINEVKGTYYEILSKKTTDANMKKVIEELKEITEKHSAHLHKFPAEKFIKTVMNHLNNNSSITEPDEKFMKETTKLLTETAQNEHKISEIGGDFLKAKTIKAKFLEKIHKVHDKLKTKLKKLKQGIIDFFSDDEDTQPALKEEL